MVAALTSGLALRQLKPLELLAMFITSLCVDLDHGGVTDHFLVNTQSPLAQLYNNISVNENHHCACVWKVHNKHIAIFGQFSAFFQPFSAVFVLFCLFF